MSMKKHAVILVLVAAGAAAQVVPSPSLAVYLAQESSNRALINTAIAASSFPKPAFGAQLVALTSPYCGYSQRLGGACVFSAAQAQNQVDMLVSLIGTNGTLAINWDPYIFLDNRTFAINARAEFDAVMLYIRIVDICVREADTKSQKC